MANPDGSALVLFVLITVIIIIIIYINILKIEFLFLHSGEHSGDDMESNHNLSCINLDSQAELRENLEQCINTVITGLLLLIVVVLVLVLICICLLYCKRRKRKSRRYFLNYHY